MISKLFKDKSLLLRLFIFVTFVLGLLQLPKLIGTPQDGQNLEVWVAATKQRCGKLQEKESQDKCYRSILREAVKKEGTAKAVEVLVLLRNKGVIDATFDDHQHAHEIGRETAKLNGSNIDAFLSCPTTYNYGCQHGFFEYTLSQTSSYEEAALKICENTPKDKPKLYAYCYHGVGHGLMMASSYNLDRALDVCNNLPQNAIQSCWQGTFMENSNLAVDDISKVRGFSVDDPLAPCNKVEDRYVWQCYINHAGYLMMITHLDFKKAAQICLSSPNSGAKPCIQSIGLMTTNPIWQKSVKGVDTINDPQKNVEVAWQICQELPEVAHSGCVIGAVGNILNFDEINISRASAFCDLVDKEYRNTCFSEIGKQVALQTATLDQALNICQSIKNQKDTISCLSGAKGKDQVAFSSLNLTAGQENQLISNDQFLKETLKEVGPKLVVEKLAVVMPEKNLICHDRAHQIGRFSYEIFGTEAFKLCSSQCHSGCYHGAAEAFFKDKGTTNLQQNLSLICQDQTNRFFSHQCIHGVGHGLMAWSNYQLYEALNICDGLEGGEAQTSCYTGVFMENIVGGLSVENAQVSFSSSRHYTKYLTSDPHYPCSAIPEKYQGSCYFLQTSRMIQLYQGDFQKVAQSCSAAPTQYQKDCFQSMGRDVGGTSKHNVKLAISKCQFAPAGVMRQECLSGAVQDTFWDPSGRDEATSFCSLLTDKSEKDRCFQTIAIRSSEVLIGLDLKSFCQNIPGNLQYLCQKEATLAKASSNTKISSPPPPQVLAATSADVTIEISAGAYKPKDVKVKKGTKVIFKNQDQDLHWPASNIHPTHTIYPEFDPQRPIRSGDNWQFIFEKVGVWRYHDHLIPTQTGTVTVEE